MVTMAERVAVSKRRLDALYKQLIEVTVNVALSLSPLRSPVQLLWSFVLCRAFDSAARIDVLSGAGGARSARALRTNQ